LILPDWHCRRIGKLLEVGEQSDQLAQNSPQVPQCHADVVAAAAQDGKERVAFGSLERASRQAAIVFLMADHRFYGAASSQELRNRAGHTAPRAADEDLHVLHAMATVSPIDEGKLRALVGQDFDLLQCLAESVTVVGIAWQRSHADHKATPVGRGHADLGAELIALVRLAHRNAIHRRFMQAVELALVLRPLRQQSVYQRDHLHQTRLQRSLRDLSRCRSMSRSTRPV